jgi:hypothetical protein
MRSAGQSLVRVCCAAVAAAVVASWVGLGALGVLGAAAVVFAVGMCVLTGCHLWASLDTTTAFPEGYRRAGYYALRGLATLSLACAAGCMAVARDAVAPKPSDSSVAVVAKAAARCACRLVHGGLTVTGRGATRCADALLRRAHAARMTQEVLQETGSLTATEATMVGAPRRRAVRGTTAAAAAPDPAPAPAPAPVPRSPMPALELPGPADEAGGSGQ